MVHRLITRDNRVKYVNEICRTEFDEDGRPVRSVGVVQDITRQKQLENDLRAIEERYRLLFNAISNGVAVYKAVDGGEDFEFVDFNSSAERMEKVNKEDIVGKRICDVFPGAEAFGLKDVLKRVWKTGAPECLPATLYEDDRIVGWRENEVFKLATGEVVALYNDIPGKK